MSSRRGEDLRAALVLAGFVVLFFLPVFAGRVISPADLLFTLRPWENHPPAGFVRPANELLSDQVFYFEPWLRLNRAEIRQGRLPLWNPYLGAGVPQLANAQAQVLSPFSLPAYVLPLTLGITVSHILVALFAGCGAYLLFRGWRLSWFPSLFGAVAFAFSGYLVVWMGHPHAPTAACLPWLFLACDRILARGRPRDGAVLAAVTALALYAGHPPTAYQGFLALSAYAAARLLARRSGQDEARPGRVRALAILVLGLATGLALWAPAGLPFHEYLVRSDAFAARGAGAVLSRSHGIGDAVGSFFVPGIFGTPTRGLHFYWPAHTNFNEVSSGYFGAVSALAALALAPLLLAGRPRRGLFFAGLFLLSCAVVYRVPVVRDLVVAIPGVRFIKTDRLVGIASFAGIALAVHFLERLERAFDREGTADGKAGAARGLLSRAVLFALLAGAAIPALLAERGGFTHRLAGWGEAHPGELAAMLQWMARGIIAYGAAWALFGAAVLAFLAGRLSRRLVRFALAAALFTDLFAFGAGYNPWMRPADVFPATPLTEELGAGPPGDARVLGVGRALLPNLAFAYGASDVRPYDGMVYAPYADFLRLGARFAASDLRTDDFASPLFDFLNVRFLVSEEPLVEGGVPAPTGALPPLVGNARASQTFRAERDSLRAVSLRVRTYGRRNDCRLTFQLYELGSGAARTPGKDAARGSAPGESALVASGALEAREFHEFAYVLLSFPPRPASAGESYRLELASPEAREENTIAFWTSAAPAGGSQSLAWNGISQPETSLCFTLHYASDRFLPRMVDGLLLSENRAALPRAFLVRDAEVVADPAARLSWLAREAASLGRRVVLTEDPGTLGQLDPAAGLARTTVQSYRADEIELSITANAGAGILVTSEMDYPGWQAEVDGRPAPVLRVNHAFRGLFLEAGDHRVRFVYRPASLRRGLALAAAAFLVLVVAVARRR